MGLEDFADCIETKESVDAKLLKAEEALSKFLNVPMDKIRAHLKETHEKFHIHSDLHDEWLISYQAYLEWEGIKWTK